MKPYTILTVDYGIVRRALLSQPLTWLEDLAQAADRHHQRLLSAARPTLLAPLGLGSMNAGSPTTVTDTLVSIPMYSEQRRHEPDQAPPCTIDVAWLGPGSTHLAVLIYRPALLNEPDDGALVHRLAEAGVLHFLLGIAERLSALAAA